MEEDHKGDYQIDLFAQKGGRRSHIERFVDEFESPTSAHAFGKVKAEVRGFKPEEYELEVVRLDPAPVVEQEDSE